MAPKDLALRCSDQNLAPISAYGRLWAPSSTHYEMSVPFNRWSWKLAGTLPEIVQTIVPKNLTQYCSSPPLCTPYYDIMF